MALRERWHNMEERRGKRGQRRCQAEKMGGEAERQSQGNERKEKEMQGV